MAKAFSKRRWLFYSFGIVLPVIALVLACVFLSWQSVSSHEDFCVSLKRSVVRDARVIDAFGEVQEAELRSGQDRANWRLASLEYVREGHYDYYLTGDKTKGWARVDFRQLGRRAIEIVALTRFEAPYYSLGGKQDSRPK